MGCFGRSGRTSDRIDRERVRKIRQRFFEVPSRQGILAMVANAHNRRLAGRRSRAMGIVIREDQQGFEVARSFTSKGDRQFASKIFP